MIVVIIKKRKTGVVLVSSIITVLLFTSLLLANAFYVYSNSAWPMIQMITPDSFRIVWWSSQTEGSVLHLFGPDAVKRTFNAKRKGFRFEAVASGLEPDSSYSYEILAINAEGEESILANGEAATAKPEGEPFSFSVFGDSGSGRLKQYQLAAVMEEYPVDLILHVGDLVYFSGEKKDYLEKFFMPYKNILATTPFYPVLGNHDVKTEKGKPFFDTFSLPDNGPDGIAQERCYWFYYSNALFVGIDSTLNEETLEELVSPWLLNVLSTSEAMWKFVYFHHPPYGSGSKTPDKKIQEILVPVIEAGGTDIVFNGHDHSYERTLPILNDQIDNADGVVYIVTGAGGKSLRSKERENPYTAVFNSDCYSFTHIEIDETTLKLEQISEQNEVIDRLVLEKK